MSLAFHRILQSVQLTPSPQTPRLWLAHLGLKETRNSARGCGDEGKGCERIFLCVCLELSFCHSSVRNSKSLLARSFGSRFKPWWRKGSFLM